MSVWSPNISSLVRPTKGPVINYRVGGGGGGVAMLNFYQ